MTRQHNFVGVDGIKRRVEIESDYIDNGTKTVEVFVICGNTYHYTRLKVYYKPLTSWNNYFNGNYGYYINVPYKIVKGDKAIKRSKKLYLYD